MGHAKEMNMAKDKTSIKSLSDLDKLLKKPETVMSRQSETPSRHRTFQVAQAKSKNPLDAITPSDSIHVCIFKVMQLESRPILMNDVVAMLQDVCVDTSLIKAAFESMIEQEYFELDYNSNAGTRYLMKEGMTVPKNLAVNDDDCDDQSTDSQAATTKAGNKPRGVLRSIFNLMSDYQIRTQAEIETCLLTEGYDVKAMKTVGTRLSDMVKYNCMSRVLDEVLGKSIYQLEKGAVVPTKAIKQVIDKQVREAKAVPSVKAVSQQATIPYELAPDTTVWKDKPGSLPEPFISTFQTLEPKPMDTSAVVTTSSEPRSLVEMNIKIKNVDLTFYEAKQLAGWLSKNCFHQEQNAIHLDTPHSFITVEVKIKGVSFNKEELMSIANSFNLQGLMA